jgi:PAS domain S-box-containing protein
VALPAPHATTPRNGFVSHEGDWSNLFTAAFKQSRNAMVLLDGHRCHVDVNGAYLRLLGYRREQLVGRPVYAFIVGGPMASEAEWDEALRAGRFTGETDLRGADGRTVAVQWAATVEVMTGRRLVLVVTLNASRWGRSFRRTAALLSAPQPLTGREREVIRLMALGSTGPEIAEELRIAHNTVRTHARNAMSKIDARSRAQLVAKALGEGWIWL